MNWRFLLAVFCCNTGFAERPITPEEYLGGADNVRALDASPIVSVEAVSVPPKLLSKGWKEKEPQIEIVKAAGWNGGPLVVRKGPIAVPPSLGLQIKHLLHEPIIVQPLPWCGNLPSHRINLKEEGHVLQIIVVPCYAGFEVYRDGKRIGGLRTGRPPDEAWAIMAALDSLLEKTDNPPNKSPEATTLARTPAADAPVAPAVGRASS